jgi:small-conductance mechanosensitive channel
MSPLSNIVDSFVRNLVLVAIVVAIGMGLTAPAMLTVLAVNAIWGEAWGMSAGFGVLLLTMVFAGMWMDRS